MCASIDQVTPLLRHSLIADAVVSGAMDLALSLGAEAMAELTNVAAAAQWLGPSGSIATAAYSWPQRTEVA